MKRWLRFRLWHIFALITVVASFLFLSQHLGFSLVVGPPCPEEGAALVCGFYIRIEWDQKMVWFWDSHDAGIPAPPAAIKDWCKSVGLFQ